MKVTVAMSGSFFFPSFSSPPVMSASAIDREAVAAATFFPSVHPRTALCALDHKPQTATQTEDRPRVAAALRATLAIYVE